MDWQDVQIFKKYLPFFQKLPKKFQKYFDYNSGGAINKKDVLTLALEVYKNDYTPPSQISNLTANPTKYSINLSWDNPKDPESIDLKGINIYLNNSLISTLPKTKENYLIENLSPGTTYNLKISTFDLKGNEGEPVEINVSTLPNQVPEAYLTIPSQKILKANSSIPINIKAIDKDGRIKSYELDFGDGEKINETLYPEQETLNLTLNHTYKKEGAYTITLKVWDNDNALATNQTSLNIKPSWIDKTWENMSYWERYDFTKAFLRKDPTDKYVYGCVDVASAIYANATNETLMKEIYGFPDTIPMCLDGGDYHLMNCVLLGDNVSNIYDWGFINMEDKIRLFGNVTVPVEIVEHDYIYESGRWIEKGSLYELSGYIIGFKIHWKPNKPPEVIVIPEYCDPMYVYPDY